MYCLFFLSFKAYLWQFKIRKHQAVENGSEIDFSSPNEADSRKRLLDDHVDNSLTKRSYFSSSETKQVQNTIP